MTNITSRLILLAVCLAVQPAGFATADQGSTSQAKTPRQPIKHAPSAATAPMARIVWLEPIADQNPQQQQERPVYRPIAPNDARLKDYERFIDTEAGRFARRLVYRAAQRFGTDPIFREPVLPIVVRKQGNHGEYGLAIQRANGVEDHPSLGYVILDPSPEYLGDTILHESGHVVHSMAGGGRRGGSPWSAFVHTTFAISDPMTALAEGYGIHLETLWGHYGNDAAKRAYYHRSSPSFEPGKGRKAEYFAPVDDLMNFAQVWARYQSVRDGWPAFEGHLYADAYARTQMDPARDRSRLKTPNAMLASEGVAASVMFWISSALAEEKGARPAGGLDQPGLVDAEMQLLEAMAALPPTTPDFRPDLLDFVAAVGRTDAHVRDIALSRFIDITRGVTARPALRARWRTLYADAIMLNRDSVKQIAEMDGERGAILERARQDVTTLRAGVGPIIPVRVEGATFELKAFGEKMPIEFDLNGMSVAEMALLPKLDAEKTARIERERERAPFASADDFAAPAGLSLGNLGLVPVELSKRRR